MFSSFSKFLTAACLIATLLPCASADIRIVGSDLLEKPVDSLRARMGSNLKLTVELRGSQPAINAITSGEATAGFLLAAPSLTPDLNGILRSPVAFQAAIFVVSASNPLEQISRSQLRGVFGGEETVKLNRWGDLGLTGEWTARSINVRSVAPRTTLAYDFFRHTVLEKPAMRPALQVDDSVDLLFRALVQDVAAIGLSPVFPKEGSGLRALAVSDNPGDTAFPPSLENIHIGDYRHRMAIDLIYSADKKAAVAPLAKLLYSEEFAADLEAAGLIPLPADLRKQLLADWSE